MNKITLNTSESYTMIMNIRISPKISVWIFRVIILVDKIVGKSQHAPILCIYKLGKLPRDNLRSVAPIHTQYTHTLPSPCNDFHTPSNVLSALSSKLHDIPPSFTKTSVICTFKTCPPPLKPTRSDVPVVIELYSTHVATRHRKL